MALNKADGICSGIEIYIKLNLKAPPKWIAPDLLAKKTIKLFTLSCLFSPVVCLRGTREGGGGGSMGYFLGCFLFTPTQ